MSTTTGLQASHAGDARRDPGTDEPRSGLVAMGKELIKEISDDDVPGLAAEVAYHAIFAIPALLVVLVTLSAVIDNVFNYELADRLYKLIDEDAPQSTRQILTSLVDSAVAQVDGGLASLGLASSVLIAIWAGSNGVGALIKSFNRAYDVIEVRSYPKRKGMAILLTIVLGMVVNFAFAIWVFGGQIGSWIAREFEMGSTFDWAWNLSRFPVGVAVIVLMLGLLYYYGPTMKQEFRWVLPGALFSTAIWGLLVFGFSIYLRFAEPGSAYGALSGTIVFLLFLYLTGLIFIVGAEVNAVLARRHDERYQRSMGQNRAERQGSIPVAAGRAAPREVPALSAGSVALGVATVVGIVMAAVLSKRG